MWKQATTGILTLGASVAGVDMSTLNVDPVRAEFALKERVTIEQRGDTVEAVLPWKDQPGLKVKYDMGTPTALEKLKDKRNKQVVVEQVSTDAMKIDIILHSKPNTNTFCYQIDGWEQYDFFYQPALTAEEIERGAVRPEEIVGSYAVYHKTLKNHEEGKTNYETGKVAHIPYPYIWSVNATSTTKHRAEAFDITDGRMCVTVAQSDLDTMEYPVRVDPTFGYTSSGATVNSIGALTVYSGSCTYYSSMARFTLNETGSISKIGAYLSNNFTDGTQVVQYGIYGQNQTFIASTTSKTITTNNTNQLQEISFSSQPTLGPANYYLAGSGSCNTGTTPSAVVYIRSDTGTIADQSKRNPGGSVFTFQEPFVTSLEGNIILSIYATYTGYAETLTDNFNDDSLDGAKWTDWGGANTNETGGELVITVNANNYYGVDSLNYYNLTDSYVMTELSVTGIGSTAAETEMHVFGSGGANTNSLYFLVGYGNLNAYDRIAGGATLRASVAYDGTTQKYIRIREDSGTVYWDYSSDGLTWSTLVSTSTPFAVTTVGVSLDAGRWAADNDYTATFDDFNIVQVANYEAQPMVQVGGAQVMVSGQLFVQ